MLAKNFDEVRGEVFPAGRLTKVIVSPFSDLKAKNFVMGYVTIFPGGSIPLHTHPQEEVYTVLEGTGQMTVGEETKELSAVSSVYIPPEQPHSLVNQESSDLVMLFVYAPAGVVDHWAEEREGKLK